MDPLLLKQSLAVLGVVMLAFVLARPLHLEPATIAAVGVAAYAASGVTRATLRGAEFIAAQTPAERVEVAYDLAERHPGSLVYCYLPEVDKAGHRYGVDSAQWVAAPTRGHHPSPTVHAPAGRGRPPGRARRARRSRA